jgi:hypothetical protein
MLPDTQHLVVRHQKIEENNQKIANILEKNKLLAKEIRENCDEIKKLREFHVDNAPNKERKVFVKACPVEDCRGFLSTSLKCGICKTYMCKECHVPKAGKHDEDHVCNKDTVATVQMLAKDTKPCPKCAVPIHFISGCDQIWCTVCHTAFSWKKGTIETGVIHNPHFYEYQRKINNGIAPRVAGDERCGGLPDIRTFDRFFKQLKIKSDLVDTAHRLVGHINHVEIHKFPTNLTDNSDLRVLYLVNRLEDKEWLSKLKMRVKRQERCIEMNQILTMFTATMTDLLNNILLCQKAIDIDKIMIDMGELREYTNNILDKIGDRFGNVVPHISETWEFLQNSKKLVNKNYRY